MSTRRTEPSWLPPLPFGESRATHNADIRDYSERMATVLTSLKRYEALGDARAFRQKSTVLLINDMKLVSSANTPLTAEVGDGDDTTLMIPFHGHNVSINGSCHHVWRAGEGAMFYPGMGRGGECDTRATLMVDLKPARLLATARSMLGLEPDARLDLGIDHERVAPMSLGSIHFEPMFRALCGLIDAHDLRADLLAMQGIDDQFYRTIARMLNPSLFFGDARGGHPPPRPAALDQALDYVMAHLDAPLHLSELERISGLSARDLRHAFQRRFQQTPRRWIWEARLARVRQSLIEARSGESVSAIAAACGFTRPDTFRRGYQHRYGESPETTMARQASPNTPHDTAGNRFLASMSHEIRTPLNAILGFTQLLREQPLAPEPRDMVEHISAAGETLLGIVNEILDFSKIEAGELQIESRPFELPMVVNQILDLLRQAAAAKGLALECTQPPEALPWLMGDALRLKQVLLNVLNNAIKFTEQGRVALEVRILERSAEALKLRFEVIDTGIGMSPATVARLFRPFGQADASISRRFGGTGLGLTISKRLIEAMGGQVGVSSELGQGSRFWFELAFPPAPEAELPRKQAPQALPESTLEGLRVLAVDDNRINLVLLERALRPRGVQVTLAGDGAQALALITADPQAFDVVLMDVRMPVMDGLAATRALRQQPATAALPVICLTAGVLPEEQTAARAAGVNDFLHKPVELAPLLELLAAYAPRPPGRTP